jgi:hypothetical protein
MLPIAPRWIDKFSGPFRRLRPGLDLPIQTEHVGDFMQQPKNKNLDGLYILFFVYILSSFCYNHKKNIETEFFVKTRFLIPFSINLISELNLEGEMKYAERNYDTYGTLARCA